MLLLLSWTHPHKVENLQRLCMVECNQCARSVEVYGNWRWWGSASGLGAVARGKAAASTTLVLTRLPEEEDPIEDWSVVSSDLEEVPPDVKVRREGHHGAMPYITADVKGKYKGKTKGKVKGDPEADEAYLRELQRAAGHEMRMERMERNEKLYGPVRREPESSSSSYPTGTSSSMFQHLHLWSNNRDWDYVCNDIDLGDDFDTSMGQRSPSRSSLRRTAVMLRITPLSRFWPRFQKIIEDRMVVMYGKGGLGKNPTATSASMVKMVSNLLRKGART